MPTEQAIPDASKGARKKYTSRACQQCRQRRAKCDGRRPACSRCVSRAVDCVFTTEVEHRGSGSRICNAILQQRVNDLEEVLRRRSIDIEASIAGIKSERGEDGKTSDTTPPTRVLQPVLPSRRGKPSPESSTSCDSPEARFFGETSGRLELERSRGLSNVEPGDVLQITSHSTSRPPSPSEKLVGDIPAELVEHLIDLYFDWEHPWCQVVDESIFRKCRGNNGRYYSPLLLNCMLAVASRYSDRPEVRTDPDDPNTAGMAYFERAEALLQADLKWPRLTTIQSLAIMAVFYVAIGSDAAGWLHHGMAIRLVLDMGLNVDSSAVAGSSHLSQEEIFLRRQIYWTLYCNDKLWALYTGRVCTMLDSQGSVPMPSLDDLDLDNPSSTPRHLAKRKIFVCFLQNMSTQSLILERILMALYGPKTRRLPCHDIPQISTFLSALQEWLDALPPKFYINFKSTPKDGCRIPQAYTLHMVYYTSIIIVTKAFSNRTCSPESRLACPHATPCPELRDRLRLQCHEAARHISLLGDMYRAVFGSFRRSSLSTMHCTLTAAQVLLCVHRFWGGPPREVPMYFQSCMDTLEEMSASWITARRFRQALAQALASGLPRPVDLCLPYETTSRDDAHALAGVVPAPADHGLPVHPLPLSTYSASAAPLFNLKEFDFSSDMLPWDYVNFDMAAFDYPFLSASLVGTYDQQQ